MFNWFQHRSDSLTRSASGTSQYSNNSSDPVVVPPPPPRLQYTYSKSDALKGLPNYPPPPPPRRTANTIAAPPRLNRGGSTIAPAPDWQRSSHPATFSPHAPSQGGGVSSGGSVKESTHRYPYSSTETAFVVPPLYSVDTSALISAFDKVLYDYDMSMKSMLEQMVGKEMDLSKIDSRGVLEDLQYQNVINKHANVKIRLDQLA